LCALGMTVLAKLANHLFVSDSPGYRSDWDRKNKQVDNLLRDAHEYSLA
jgi:hypothetical protein